MPNHPFYKSKFWLGLRARALVRDGYRCSVPGCNATRHNARLYVDHISPRPYSDSPTAADVLSNLRTLCEYHDTQIRQLPNGARRKGGELVARGCDAEGVPLDPKHPWRRQGAAE